jgi:hypothetical protein
MKLSKGILKLPYAYFGGGRHFFAAAIVEETADMMILKCLHICEPGNSYGKKIWFTVNSYCLIYLLSRTLKIKISY